MNIGNLVFIGGTALEKFTVQKDETTAINIDKKAFSRGKALEKFIILSNILSTKVIFLIELI